MLQSAESLAGRARYLELGPLLLEEVRTEALSSIWLCGGIPDSFQAASDRASLAWRQDFLRTDLERDIPALGPRIPAATLRRFWTMLAHAQSGLLYAASLAEGRPDRRALSCSAGRSDAGPAPDALVREQWKRLVKSPKVYVRDSGLTHAPEPRDA